VKRFSLSTSPRAQSWLLAGGIAISGLLYTLLLYKIPRSDFWPMLACFVLLFSLYAGMVWVGKKRKEPRLLTFLLGAAIAFRLIAFFALPELSDDYFRFVWDGKLLAQGINPFAQLPSGYPPSQYESLGLSRQLFDQLNSPDYFTIYPPLCQLIFWLGVVISPDSLYASVLVMKSFLLLAEVGSIFLLLRLLRHWRLPKQQVLWYALNPLVIVELSGNLHFEGLMIFFLLLSLWLLVRGSWLLAALPFALAVISKLLPLMLLPLLLPRLGFWRSLAFALVVIGISLLAFLPIFDLDTFLHLFDSIQLYFQSFEFNASFYYLLRWLGKLLTGYNLIKVFGIVLAGFSLLGILWISWAEKKPGMNTLAGRMLAVWLFYLLMATTVHPWYVTPLAALAVLGPFRFPFVWTALLPLTYVTYQSSNYQENFYFVALEYGVLLAYLVWEVKNKKLITFFGR
jgi:alpha-1,6-mannosyltransferase